MKQFVHWMMVLVAMSLFSACSSGNSSNTADQEKNDPNKGVGNQQETAKPELTNLWKTQQVLDVPESVLYDKERDVLYVANIQGKPTEKDGKGFISILHTDGSIKEKKWVTGLDAPKGMGVHNGNLYVTNIDELVRIDIQAGTVEQRFPLVNAQFANDIDINAEGVVFVSDMKANRVYKLQDDVASIWLDDKQLNNPNGLYAEENELLIGMKGKVLRADYASGELATFIKNTGSIDGLKHVADKWYIISDWTGHVHLIHPDREKILILDTADEDINAADIEFDPDKQRLFVPTFFDNRVMAYKLKR